jgi:hypothetical protein
MALETFISAVFWIVVGLAAAFFALRALAKRYPGTALRPFRSKSDVADYFRFAREIIGADTRLMRYPVYIVAATYVLYLPGWLYIRASVAGTWGHSALETIPDLPLMPITPRAVLQALARAPQALMHGYFGFLASSSVVLIVTLVATLACGWFVGWLRRRAEGRDLEGLVFLRTTLGVLRQPLLAVGVILAGALILRLPQFAFWSSLALSVVVGLASLLTVSLIEGVILNYVWAYVSGREASRGELLARSVSVLKPMFQLNIILSIGLMLGAFVVFPFSLSTMLNWSLDVANSYYPSFPYRASSVIATYFSPVFALVTVCAPFVLVRGRMGVRDAVRANLAFVGRHFLKYVTVVGAGTAVLFIPRVLDVLLAAVVPRMSPLDFLVRFGLAILSIALAVIVFLALFKFYHDCSKA